jgi:hypothetical protein
MSKRSALQQYTHIITNNVRKIQAKIFISQTHFPFFSFTLYIKFKILQKYGFLY